MQKGSGGEARRSGHAQSPLEATSTAFGGFGPFGEGGVGGVLERSSKVLPTVLVELRETKPDRGLEAVDIRCGQSGEESLLLVIELSPTAGDARIEQTCLDRTIGRPAAASRSTRKRPRAGRITCSLRQLGVGQMVSRVVFSVHFVEVSHELRNEGGQRNQVVGVVLDDLGDGGNVSTVEIVEIELRNERAGNVVFSVHPEHFALELHKSNRPETRPKDAPRAMQEVDVRRKYRSAHSIQHESISKKRPIERLTVEGDDARALLNTLAKPVEHGSLAAELWQKQLLNAHRFVFEPTNADEKRNRSSTAGEPSGFRVEKQGVLQIDLLETWIEGELREARGRDLKRFGYWRLSVMVSRLEILVDQMKLAMLSLTTGARKRTAHTGNVELPRSGLCQTL